MTEIAPMVRVDGIVPDGVVNWTREDGMLAIVLRYARAADRLIDLLPNDDTGCSSNWTASVATAVHGPRS